MKTQTVNDKTYKVSESGTFYHETTPDEVINALELIRDRGIRVKLCYGDVKMGRQWMEEYDIIGTIGRSCGTVKIPLIISNERSHGGPGILDHCILKITGTKDKRIYYKSEKYAPPVIDIVASDLPEYQFNTLVNGNLHGRHKTLRSAQRCKSILS